MGIKYFASRAELKRIARVKELRKCSKQELGAYHSELIATLKTNIPLYGHLSHELAAYAIYIDWYLDELNIVREISGLGYLSKEERKELGLY